VIATFLYHFLALGFLGREFEFLSCMMRIIINFGIICDPYLCYILIVLDLSRREYGEKR